jgi:cobalt-zinc-cadmium efflux system protein
MTAHHVHGPTRSENRAYAPTLRNMLAVLLITAGVMVAEIMRGLLANSLALISDAGHMLTDILALGMSLAAIGI